MMMPGNPAENPKKPISWSFLPAGADSTCPAFVQPFPDQLRNYICDLSVDIVYIM